MVSIGVLEIISHGSYEAQRHGDWPISMALTTVPELHCGTVKGIACLTNLFLGNLSLEILGRAHSALQQPAASEAIPRHNGANGRGKR